MGIDQLREFLFWCLIVNGCVYAVTALGVLAFRDLVVRLNTRMFGLDEGTIRKSLWNYVAAFKLLVVIFNFAPWLALVILR